MALEVGPDIQRLARVLKGSKRGQGVWCSDSVVGSDLFVRDMVLSELIVAKTVFFGGLHLEGCRIQRLKIIDSSVAGSILLVGCDLGEVALRSVQGSGSIRVVNSRAGWLEIHAAHDTSLSDLRVAGDVRLSQPGARLAIERLIASSLLIYGPEREDADVGISSVELSGRLSVVNLSLGRLSVEGALAADCILTRLECPERLPLELRGLSVARTLMLDGLSGAGQPLVSLSESVVGGSATIRNMHCRSAGAPYAAAFEHTKVSGDLRVHASASEGLRAAVKLDGCEVRGALLPPIPLGRGAVLLDSETYLEDIRLPADVHIDRPGAVAVARSVFGRAGGAELRALRRALIKQARPEEDDAVYYVLRSVEAQDLPLIQRYIARWGKEALFGWGVRVWAPARALAWGVALSAAGLHASGAIRGPGEGLFSVAALARGLAVAASLWLGVAVGLPMSVRGTWWAGAAVVASSLGVLLITLAVGILIRRLVR